MAITNGNSITITASNTEAGSKLAFAHSTNATFSYSNSLVEATLGVSNQWTEYVSGKKTTSISFSGLTDYSSVANRHNIVDLADYLIDATEIYFSFGSGDNVERGSGYITEITLEAASDDVASYSGVLVVTDELNEDLQVTTEFIQDSSGNNILDDAGQPIRAIIPT